MARTANASRTGLHRDNFAAQMTHVVQSGGPAKNHELLKFQFECVIPDSFRNLFRSKLEPESSQFDVCTLFLTRSLNLGVLFLVSHNGLKKFLLFEKLLDFL